MKRRMTIVLLMLMTVVVSVVAHDVKTISCSHLVRDYQGSIMSQVDSTGFWHNDWSYDAWGRPRNPQTHVVYNPSALTTYSSAYRGYCGHEHQPQFGLINMKVSDKPDEQSEARFDFAMARKLRVNLNARLYDPITSRFLSPDPYVQMPDYTQSFNRYSYCLNNPLKYVDENGEEILTIFVIAVIAGTMNLGWQYYNGNVNNFWQGFAAFGVGAAAGALGAGVGGYIFTLAGGGVAGAGGFLAGAAGGGAGGAANSLVKELGNFVFLDNDFNGWNIVTETGLSAVAGGVFNGLQAVKNGKNFLDGSLTNYSIVQKAANYAEVNIGGEGHVAGTKKHAHAKELVKRYQEIHGDRELVLETNVERNGIIIRPDVVDNKNKMIYDYKFYHHKISPQKFNLSPQMMKYREVLQMPTKVIIPLQPYKKTINFLPSFIIRF